MTDILTYFPEELAAELQALGEPAYRAGQLFDWLHVKRVREFAAMLNLPAPLREKLGHTFTISRLCLKKRLVSAMDGTVKYLYGLPGGGAVEGVLMRHRHGNSLCISTQVGCRMGCRFCASTLGGLERNLTAGELLAEVYEAADDLAPLGEKVSSVVLMGIGEPLDNFDEVCRFLELLSHPKGFGMSLRHVSLSTCGIVEGIRKLAEKRYPLTLSVSLHASDDESRSALMPVNRKDNLASLLGACRDYFAKTGRRVSYEYALIAGENDTPQHAKRLAALLRGMNCHVNLIPHNPVAEREYARPDPAVIRRFQEILTRNGIAATIRRELGADVAAACGQLRRESAPGPLHQKQEGILP